MMAGRGWTVATQAFQCMRRQTVDKRLQVTRTADGENALDSCRAAWKGHATYRLSSLWGAKALLQEAAKLQVRQAAPGLS